MEGIRHLQIDLLGDCRPLDNRLRNVELLDRIVKLINGDRPSAAFVYLVEDVLDLLLC